MVTTATSPDDLNLRRNPGSVRSIFDLVMTSLTVFAALVALFVLGTFLYLSIVNGLPGLNLDGLTRLTPAPQSLPLEQLAPDQKGGFGNALVGTIIVVALATGISLPIGMMAAIYLSEFGENNRIADGIRFAVKVLSGVPSIIAGVFAYGVLVVTLKTYSALSGGVAISVLMLPIIILSTEEALRLVPRDVRSAALSLGATRFQMISRVVLPAALPVIFTGVTLAIARAAGETAPLIFTALFSSFWISGINQPTATLSVMIYNFALVPFENQRAVAWTGSLVLVLLVLLTSVSFRILLRPKL